MSSLFSADGISKRYSNTTIFENISFDVNEDEIYTLIGKNGAGKSTLAKIILGLEKNYAGTTYRREKLKYGYVPQSFKVNSALPINAKCLIDLTADAKLKKDDKLLGDIIKSTSIDQILDSQLNKLSQGQLQRVLIASSLVVKPDILVLDEPLQGLDCDSISMLYSMLQEIKKHWKITIFIISHQIMGFKYISDKFFHLNEKGLNIYNKDQQCDLLNFCSYCGIHKVYY